MHLPVHKHSNFTGADKEYRAKVFITISISNGQMDVYYGSALKYNKC